MKALSLESGSATLRSSQFWLAGVRTALAIGVATSIPATTHADENGVSFWLPGLFGSLAAVPQQPGWALTVINYYDSVGASGAVAASREITIGRFSPTVNVNLNVNLQANVDAGLVNPSYVFATPVFGGQLALGVMGLVETNHTALDGTLTLAAGPLAIMRQGSISQTTTGMADLYPQAIIRWTNGVNNWMVYGTGDIPVGEYSSSNLANIGIGHGAADGGAGYTYFDPKTGHEFSAVTGFTYNLIDPSTGYQNGIDWHLDRGASQFLSKQLLVGAVGYVYQQITPDNGCNPMLCPFESRVIAIGPQIGYIFPVGNLQGYVNLKAYWEFAAQDRPSGWNTWLTLSFSPSAAASAPSPMVTK
jgi:hypothetical protein